jgi:ribonuclease BN (tRNA processing enzyme)
LDLIADDQAMLDDIFEVDEYAADRRIEFGSLRVQPHAVQHYIPSHAMRINAAGGPTLVFSSDAAPCPQVVEAARDADLFLCESAIVDTTQDRPDPLQRGHLTAAEAGAAARKAAVKRLLLTHYRSGPEYDAQHYAAAASTFGGPVELAQEGRTYRVG